MLARLSRAPVVSIVSIRGRATGVGSELALASDMRFASREKAILSQWEVGAGLVPGGGPMARLPRLIGRGRALEVLLGADDIPGDLAELYGYVNRALPDGELDAFVDALAVRIASFDKQAIAETKRLSHINDRARAADRDPLSRAASGMDCRGCSEKRLLDGSFGLESHARRAWKKHSKPSNGPWLRSTRASILSALCGLSGPSKRRESRFSHSHSYEADVVKPLTCFFRFLHHFRWFCVWQMRARNERTAAKTQKTVTCQCAAKLGQQRNGIIGRGPRSGKETVYAGFDLDQA